MLYLDLPEIQNPLLPPPEKLFGFTYVSFFIEKTTLPASMTTGGRASYSIGATPGKVGGFSLSSTFGRRPSEKNMDHSGRERTRPESSYIVPPTATAAEAAAAAAAAAAAKAAEERFYVRISVYNVKGKLTEAQQVLKVEGSWGGGGGRLEFVACAAGVVTMTAGRDCSRCRLGLGSG